MRKITSFILILILSLSMAGFANAEPANILEALTMANDELRIKNDSGNYFFSQNKQGKPINEALWSKSKLFSYGSPQEASPGANDFDPITNQHRYHGYTMNSEKYTNTFFRNDTKETVDVNGANWIQYPWMKDNVQNFVKNVMHEPELDFGNPFNNDPALLESINQGFENLKLYNPYMKFQRDGTQWQSFVHILQPSSRYSFGMGRLFRIVNGQMRYLTIPLAPTLEAVPPDFSVTLEKEKFANVVKPGEKITFTVTYMLNKDHPKEERAWLRLHHQVGDTEHKVTLTPLNPADKPDANGYILVKPGESKTYQGTITVQSTSCKIIGRINPVDTGQDKDWSNNRAEAVIVPNNPPQPEVNPQLILTAVSQDGKINRPAGTAKWTDMVAAKVKMPKPTTTGVLDWWHILDCRITYPAKHPEFVFGNPVPPKGTVLPVKMSFNTKKYSKEYGIPDTIDGRAGFEENWAMDGTKIWNPIKEQLMAANPKNYPITVKYTQEYQHTYSKKQGDEWVTVTKIVKQDKTITANLLVNGTGVNSRAQ